MKNVKVEYLRFFSSILIMFCHMYMLDGTLSEWPLKGGYIAVEFFFFLTGYLTTAHWEKMLENKRVSEKNEEYMSTKYMLNKILRVVPYTTISYIMLYSYFLSSIEDKCKRSITKCLAK